MTRLERTTERNITRRSFLKKSSAAAIGFLGLCAVPFYGYYQERNWIEEIELELPYRSLPKPFDGLRIAHFSDVHYGFHYDLEQLTPLIDRINALGADLILFTGDLFDADVVPYAEEVTRELQRLTAPLGKFAVPGNHDYYTGKTHAIRVYEQSGLQLLTNRCEVLRVGGQAIQLVGLDDMFYGDVDIDAAFSGTDANVFTILLAHEPDYADRTSAYRVDLQLSGHSHAGQVRLPLIGPVLTPPGGRKYVQGLARNESQDTESYVYTTRGIGTTHIPIRLLCRPELTVITLRRATG